MFDLFPPEYVPLVIFFSRIVDVSLGTIRIMMVSKGMKGWAAVLGFFEVFIWAMVITELIANLDGWINFVAYAGGFAAGNYIGIYLESLLKVGTVIVRIITQDKFHELTKAIKKGKFGMTTLDGRGTFVNVKVIFIILKRKRIEEIVSLIKEHDPQAFYTIEDVKYALPRKEFKKRRKSGFYSFLGMPKRV